LAVILPGAIMSQRNRIRTVACVGAGTIGRSWAVLFAGKGIEVRLQDVSEEALKSARRTVSRNFRDLVRFKLLIRSAAKAAANRISYTRNLQDSVSVADYVQEAVPEYIGLKRRMFREISEIVDRDVIIASSSGGLLPSKIQSAASFPGRCLVVHPCQTPVHMTRLVEIVPGRLTTASTVRNTTQLLERIGKRPILVKHETQDYITNRLQFTLWREAFDMVGRGIASAGDIDAALCEMARASTCIGLGPFMQAHIHGGPHGQGGIEGALKYYSAILPETWRSLARWSKIPKPVLDSVRRSVRDSARKRGMSTEQLSRWLDRQLLAVASLVWCD
jgi:carnitine 3-dehydrogenase